MLTTLVEMTGNNFPEEFQRIWKYSHGSLPKEEFDQAKKEAQIGFEKLHSDIVKEQPKAVHAYLRKRCDQTTLLLTCASCGLRHPEVAANGKMFDLSSLNVLKFSLAISQDVARKDRILAAGRAESVFSFFTYDRIDFWHLHSQFVETKEDGSFEALLCGECATYVDDWNVDKLAKLIYISRPPH